MQSSLPVDRYPGPVCSYEIDEETPVVRNINPAFETRFGSVESGASVVDTLGEFGVDETDLGAKLTSSGQFTVHSRSSDEQGGHYLVQVVPPTDDDGGFLIFTPSSQDNARDGSDPGALGVDNVASVISHDLRNPLDVAKARLRAAREYNEAEHFDHVAQAHERMERIIQDVLTLTRGEDAIDLDEEIELGAVAARAWETVATDDAVLQVGESLPTIVADPDRIGRLFENLFRNAVEHNSKNDQPVDISTASWEADPQHSQDAAEPGVASREQHDRPDDRERSTDEDPTATGKSQSENGSAAGVTVRVGELANSDGFYVADDGPGIPEEKRDQVLKPGYSSDDHGTGLGLAIVEKIASAHDWNVRISAADAGGARIEVGDF